MAAGVPACTRHALPSARRSPAETTSTLSIVKRRSPADWAAERTNVPWFYISPSNDPVEGSRDSRVIKQRLIGSGRLGNRDVRLGRYHSAFADSRAPWAAATLAFPKATCALAVSTGSGHVPILAGDRLAPNSSLLRVR